MGSTVTVEREHPGVATVVLNRPDRLNAINNELLDDLVAILDELELDTEVRVIVLTGAGRGFCAGLDLKGFGRVPGTEGLGAPLATMLTQQKIAAAMMRLRGVRKPVIAAVNGAAAGGGLAFVCHCDVRIAARSARFNAAFVRIGLSGCDQGVSWVLPRLVGAGKAHLLMLTGRLIDAEEACRDGLVVEVVDDDALRARAYEIADEIARNSPLGVWMTKEVMWAALEIPGEEAAIDLEDRTQILTSVTADATEGRQAFLEKRPPEYRWR